MIRNVYTRLFASAVPKPAAPGGPGRRAGMAPGHDELTTRLRRIRVGMWSANPRVRLAALIDARVLNDPDLLADVAVALAHETSIPCRRVATKVLREGDPLLVAQLERVLRDGS